MDKVYACAADALHDVSDGASVAVGGFGVRHGFPSTLLGALIERGTRELTLICNSLGATGPGQAQGLVEHRRVRRLIASFSARPGMVSAAEAQIRAGELEVELVPQGVLVERLRAGGTGIPAFYTRVGVGSPLSEGKEVRVFDGESYVLEYGLTADFALLRATRADRHGNVEFGGATRNLGPAIAKGARVTIVEVEQIVEPGTIAPERVDLPGVFVDRVVPAADRIAPVGATSQRRPPEDRRLYLGRPGLTRAEIAHRAARLLPSDSYVNLGTGIPTLVGHFIDGRDVVLHAENGVLGYGEVITGDAIDPNVYNAAGAFVALRPGAAFFDSITSFEMARSGRLAAVVLGAYQVDAAGNLANWSTGDVRAGGVGGAMDLVSGEATVIVTMEHTDSRHRPKLVPRCDIPITRPSCVDVVVTDLALLRRSPDGFVLEETAQGFSAQDVQSLTPMPLRWDTEPGCMNEVLLAL